MTVVTLVLQELLSIFITYGLHNPTERSGHFEVSLHDALPYSVY